MNVKTLMQVLSANPDAQGVIVRSLVADQVILSTMIPIAPDGWTVVLSATNQTLKQRAPELLGVPRWVFKKV